LQGGKKGREPSSWPTPVQEKLRGREREKWSEKQGGKKQILGKKGGRLPNTWYIKKKRRGPWRKTCCGKNPPQSRKRKTNNEEGEKPRGEEKGFPLLFERRGTGLKKATTKKNPKALNEKGGGGSIPTSGEKNVKKKTQS